MARKWTSDIIMFKQFEGFFAKVKDYTFPHMYCIPIIYKKIFGFHISNIFKSIYLAIKCFKNIIFVDLCISNTQRVFACNVNQRTAFFCNSFVRLLITIRFYNQGIANVNKVQSLCEQFQAFTK